MNKIDMLKPVTDVPESDLVSRMAVATELAENPAVVKEVTKYGKIPVIYVPHRSSLKKLQDPGLSVLIQNAMTEQEVNNLLIKGKLDYKNASLGTIKRWEKIAKKRIAEINK